MKVQRAVLLFALVIIAMMTTPLTSIAQFIPNAIDPPAGVHPTWGKQLSINHNQESADSFIPYFFVDGHPEIPYDLIWHVWLEIDRSGGNPATFAGMRFTLDTEETHEYLLYCDTGGWYSNFNTRYYQPIFYETSVAGSSALLEWTSTNGGAIAIAGFWCEEDD